MKEKRTSLAAICKRSTPAPLDIGNQLQASPIAEDSASEYDDCPVAETTETGRQGQPTHEQGPNKASEEHDTGHQTQQDSKGKQTKATEKMPIKGRKKQPSKSLSISLPEKLHRSVTHPGLVASAQTPLTSFWKRHKEEHHHPTSNNSVSALPAGNGPDSSQPRSPTSATSPTEPMSQQWLSTSRNTKDGPTNHGTYHSANRSHGTDKMTSPDGSFGPRRPSDRSETSKDTLDVKRFHDRVYSKDAGGDLRAEVAPRKTSTPYIRVASPIPMISRIYRGLVSNDFPDLLVPPTSLHCIDIRVASSRMRPKRNSYLSIPSKQNEEDAVFTLGVFYQRSEGDMNDSNVSPTFPAHELWRIEKTMASLLPLDSTLKTLVDLKERPPDRAAFSGHSPAKVDVRRAALNAYFKAALGTVTGPHGNVAAQMEMCHFLSTDVIEPRDDETTLIDWNRGKVNFASHINGEPHNETDDRPRMEGYLTKRGKNFGGWKARYFVLHSPKLMYYECPGGTHLGTIKIQYAQIGKQSAEDPQTMNSNVGAPGSASGHDDSENQYRHAFLILEPKRRDSNALVRHVLCAESDEERDAWVDALLCYVEDRDDDDSGSHHSGKTMSRDGRPVSSGPVPSGPSCPYVRKKSKLDRTGTMETHDSAGDVTTLRSLSYDSFAGSETPGSADTPGYRRPDEQQRYLHANLNISGPTNGSVIRDASTWGNVAPNRNGPTPLKEKKRSIWGFNRGGNSSSNTDQSRNDEQAKEPVLPVFGLALSDAINQCPPRKSEKGMESGLPAVVYRCIAYLRAHNAHKEEGIFRLSGSNIVVRQLRDRFNAEGDVDLLSEGEPYLDVHAVASLFKQYLRELPESLLTGDLHMEFYKVLEEPEHTKKVASLNTLIRLLPPPNKTVLLALMELLTEIVNNSEVNRMTVRNVGIVFAPSLNIPAPVITMFLNDYDLIFGSAPLDDDFSADDSMTTLKQTSSRTSELRIQIPGPESQSQQETDNAGNKRSNVQELTTPVSVSPADSFRTAYTGSTSPVTGPHDPPLPPISENPLLKPSHKGSRANFRATISGMNGLLIPPGEEGSNSGGASARQKRRESGMIYMDMDQFHLKSSENTVE
ncbi:erv26 super protein [Ascosphaera pollenicola]|nr:erv26 super protein [Ascosphaera pollenicola]